MRTSWIALLGLIGLMAAGCRTDPAVAMLERDNRQKEDEIYRLRWRVQELEDECQSDAPAAAAPGRSSNPDELPPEGTSSRRRPATRAPVSRSRTEPRRGADQPPLDKIEVEIPEQAMPEQPPPSTAQPDGLKPFPPTVAPKAQPPAGNTPIESPGGAPKVLPGAGPANAPGGGSGWYRREIPADPVSDARTASSRVAQITLNASLTGGIGGEMTLSDQGLLAVVEPRDITGNIVDAPGDINAVLYDTAVEGEASRVGRWDFTAAETTSMLRPSPDHGIHLTLPWTAGPPEHARLKLFVRYTTQDGRKLQVERNVVVALAHDAQPERRPPPVEQSVAEPQHTASRPQRPVWSPDRTY